MDDFRTFLDGRRFMTDSPFRSGYFVVASVAGLGAVLTDAYLIVRHWQTLNEGVVITLGIVIGVQLIYQWWRTLRYYSQIRKLDATKAEGEAKEGTPLDGALRLATGGLTDILFYCYGMTLVALILIGVLLTHLDRVR